MAKVNSNEKGNRGERDWARHLRDIGWEARRSQQYQGVRDEKNSADVITNMPGLRAEVKKGYNNEELWTKEVQEWVETAREETPEDELWYIAWRRDWKKWTLIFELDGVVMMTHEVEKALDLLLDRASVLN